MKGEYFSLIWKQTCSEDEWPQPTSVLFYSMTFFEETVDWLFTHIIFIYISCVYVSAGVCRCVQMCACHSSGGEDSLRCKSLPFTLSAIEWLIFYAEYSRPIGLWVSSLTCYPVRWLSLQTGVSIFSFFYVGIWDLNPGPHVCTVSTLRTEPYFPLFFSVLETKLILNVAETVLSIVGALSNHLLWTQASLAGHGR